MNIYEYISIYIYMNNEYIYIYIHLLLYVHDAPCMEYLPTFTPKNDPVMSVKPPGSQEQQPPADPRLWLLV